MVQGLHPGFSRAMRLRTRSSSTPRSAGRRSVGHLTALRVMRGCRWSSRLAEIGYDIPFSECQPAGSYLGESFHRAGGVPAVMRELLAAGKLHGNCLSVAGQTIGEDLKAVPDRIEL